MDCWLDEMKIVTKIECSTTFIRDCKNLRHSFWLASKQLIKTIDITDILYIENWKRVQWQFEYRQR